MIKYMLGYILKTICWNILYLLYYEFDIYALGIKQLTFAKLKGKMNDGPSTE